MPYPPPRRPTSHPRRPSTASRSRAVLLLGVLLAAAPPPARALSFAPLTPAEVAAASSDVIIATVVRVADEVRHDGSLVQHLDLAVHERWKGSGGSLVARTQVLTVADQRRPGYPPRSIAGNFTLALGRTYLLFLREPAALPRVPITTAGEIGAYFAERAQGSWRFSTLDGRRVIGVTRRAWTYESTAPSGREAPLHAGPGSVVRERPRATTITVPDGVAAAWRALVAEVTP